MKEIILNNTKYLVVKNYNDALDEDALKEKMTEYFENFDYIVGDWAYGKIRLKGFYDSTNKSVKNINDIKNLDDYINNYCAYGCKYFVLKKD